MSYSHGGLTARVIPIYKAPDENNGSCPLALRERMREQLYPPYRSFATATRAHRRAMLTFAQQRRTARNPLTWLNASLGQIESWVEYKLAKREQANVAQGLDHARVNAALGWAADFNPVCTEQSRPSRLRQAFALLTSAALVITPVKAEHLPLTPEQKGDWLAYLALCNSGSGQRPDMPTPPCHAPKIGLRNEGKLMPRKTLA